MALRSAMRRTPSESATVTMAGRPSGMAATASEIATRSATGESGAEHGVGEGLGERAPVPMKTRGKLLGEHDRGDCEHDERDALADALQLRCSGVSRPPARRAGRRSCPSRCRWPVPVTIERAAADGHGGAGEDHVDTVSERRVRASATARGGLAHRFALASERRLLDPQCCRLDRRPSAGIWSPASRMTRSPTTRSAAAMSSSRPSRTTLAVGADICLSAESACSARYSCAKPSTRVEQKDRSDCDGVDPLALEARERRADEDPNHEVLELPGEQQPCGISVAFAQHVGTMLGKPARGLP